MTEITGKSVYISLSIDMYETILKDIRVFRCGSKAGNDSYKLSYSQFLKRIFLNLYNKKEVMEYVKECVKRYEKKIEQHKKKSGKNKNHGEVIKLGNNIICKLIEQISGFDDNLLEILFFTAENSNIKKVIEKVKENSSLDGFQEYELPNGAALALIFVSNIEYYCNLRMIEREKIIYRREIEDIETYIKNKNIITIRKNNGQIVTVLPYRIGIVDESNRHCLACFRIKKESEGWYFEKTETVPIKQIVPYDAECLFKKYEIIDPEKDIHFYAKEKNWEKCDSYSKMVSYIDKRISWDGYEYLSAPLEKVFVKLTPMGFEILDEWNDFRPEYEIDKDDTGVIKFRATFLQTVRYFFKFGDDATITDPKNYVKQFKSLLRKMNNNYNPVPENEVRVRLTKKGFAILAERDDMRPDYVTDENDNKIIIFKSDFLSTFRYFFKFGKEATIICPTEYIDKFKKMLKSLNDIYGEDNGSTKNQNG